MKTNVTATPQPSPRLVQPPPADAALSEGIARLMLRLEQEGSAELTLAHYRQTAWSLFEFLHCDPPLRELDRETAARWLDWLRTSFIYRRGRGAYPKSFTRADVSAFLNSTPAKRTQERFRGAATVGQYRAQGCHLLRWLGVPVELERRKRRKFRRLPPIVPKIEAIAARWQATLQSQAAPPAHRRQVVLTQALVLLWGVRLKEGLTASLDDVEGHWVLCEAKTGMRIGYLNAQALGIVQALRAGPGGQTTWSFAASRHNRVSGWPWGLGKWHQYVRALRIDDGEKPQQDLRKRFSTWVAGKDPQVEMLLAGHGGNVVFTYYLDTLERVPGVMEQFDLPQLDGWTWPPPIYPHRPAAAQTWGSSEEAAATAKLVPPRGLYARFDRWLQEQERNAAE